MSGFSKVRIANLALALVHTKTIESLSETSAEATQANLWYDIARQEVLELFNWPFARTRLILAAHDEAVPEAEWAYRYQYPADCLAARYIENPAGTDEDAVPFEQEYAADGTLSIVTDAEDAVLVYTRDATEPELFPSVFVTLLAHKLATYLVGTLSGKVTLEERLNVAYMRLLGTNPAAVANQERQRAPRDAAHIRGR